MPSRTKIDIHQHLVPPFWADYLRQHPSPHRLPEWSPEEALASMDRQGIAKAYLSLSVPGVLPWPAGERAEVARQVNGYTADLVVEHPDRFGNLATLPLPDVDAAIAETAYAFEAQGVDGVIVLTNYGDSYLGDPAFEPLWDELDRRAAVVLVHPDSTSLPDLNGIPAAMVDFPFATTRTAVDMVFKGVLDRHPNVRVVLSHAGGFLPYAAERFVRGGSALPGMPGRDHLMAVFRRFYLDTALSTGPLVLPSLLAFADPSHIVFGSDYPYAAGQAEEFTAALDANPLLTDEMSDAITQGNLSAVLAQKA